MVRLVLLFLMLVTAGGCAWNPGPLSLQPEDLRAIPEIRGYLDRARKATEKLRSIDS